MSTSSKRVIVMTGGTYGIGKIAAKHLGLGNKLIMGARSVKTGTQYAEQLQQLGRDVTYLPLDLSDPDSIKEFATAVLKIVGDHGIDVLLLNAAVYMHKKSTLDNIGGVEQTLMINHFGGHMLFELLKGALKQRYDATKGTGAPKPRVIPVSSLGHTDIKSQSFWHPPVGKFDFEKSWDPSTKTFKTIMLSGKSKYRNVRAYTDSKLCAGLLARKLTREYGSFLDSVFINPGFTPGSDLDLLKSSILNRVLKHIIPLAGWSNTLEQAADVLVEASLRDSVVSGEYYGTCPEVKNSERFGIADHNPEADDTNKQDKLYQIGLDLIEKYTTWKLPLVADEA